MTPCVRVVAAIGTRPEAIKLAPVVARLRSASWCEVVVVATAQHRELLDEATRALGLRVDVDLDLMRPSQAPADLLGRAIVGLNDEFARLRPQWVLAQGDTNSVLAAALAAFQNEVPFAHVEAGLRTAVETRPFPEEMNRRLVSRLATLHFAPTTGAAECLEAEGVAGVSIVVTGNPVVDALESVRARLPQSRFVPRPGRSLAVMTLHRREHHEAEIRAIAAAVRTLCDEGSFDFIIPIHPNHRCGAILSSELRATPGARLIEPVGYLEFLALLGASRVVLSDSGGVQEEAPSFGVPVLILRHETERVEAIAAGFAQLVGCDTDRIVECARRIAAQPAENEALRARGNPFGDGRAAERIVEALRARC